LAEIEKPLVGKSVVVTRAFDQAVSLVRALEGMGAEVLCMPTVEFARTQDTEALDEAIQHLSRFDWVLLTSQNAVRFLAERADELGRSSEWLSQARARIAAVGRATEDAAEQKGINVDFVAKQQNGESLVQGLADEMRGKNVLVPRSDKADDRLPEALRTAGAQVTEVVAYRTAVPQSFDAGIMNRIRSAQIDAVVFASPSAFQNFQAAMPEVDVAALSSRIQFAVIGPTTARALRDAGARVAIEANEASSAAMADAVAKYFLREPATVRQSS
jgi:uroporphyrinogen III methyltransferase/synthase